jgi:hypothetical protein
VRVVPSWGVVGERHQSGEETRMNDTRLRHALSCLDEARTELADLMDNLPEAHNEYGALKLVRSCINLAIQFLNHLIPKDAA